MPYEVIHGNEDADNYVLIKDDNKYLIVFAPGLGYKWPVLFEVAYNNTDWPLDELLDAAREVVDYLNTKEESQC